MGDFPCARQGGDYYVDQYIILSSCGICTAGSQTAYSEEEFYTSLLYFDGDNGSGALLSATIILHVEYTETYKNDGSKFISFNSENYCWPEEVHVPPDAPDLLIVANACVDYYNSSETCIYSNILDRFSIFVDNRKVGSVFTINSLPSYSNTGATAVAEGSFFLVERTLTINYTY